jgi:hypothetical protein
MIDHIWTVVCSRAVIDNQSNNFSLQNVIEQLSVQDRPGPEKRLYIRLNVASFWVRTDPAVPATGFFRLRLQLPSGETVDMADELEIDLAEHERFRTRVALLGLPLREPGRHHFVVDLRSDGETEWRRVSAVPLRLNFTEPDE